MNNNNRSASLVSYINQLQKGNISRNLYNYHREELENCSAEEVNLAIDNLIIRYGDVEKIEKSVARFIRAAGKGLDKKPPILPDNESIFKILMDENRKIESLIVSIKSAYQEFLSTPKDSENILGNGIGERLSNNLEQVKEIKTHYLKLQNGLFSVLEEYSDNIRCIKLMWYLQDIVIENLNALLLQLSNPFKFNFHLFNKLFGDMFFNLNSLIYREEKILYPLAIRIIPLSIQKKLNSEIESYGIL